MTEKPAKEPDQEKARRELALRIQRHVAFASGIFQQDVTVRTMLESLAEGVVIIDNSGTVLLINTRAEEMFGYSREELVGQPHALLIPERFRASHEEHETNFFREPRIRPMGQLLTLAGRRKDGSEFPAEISLSYLDTINGIIILAFISDITHRRQNEDRLRKSEHLFNSFMLHLPAAAWIKDLNGRYVYANAEAERIFATPLSELQGRTDNEIFPPETARQFRENDQRVLAEEESIRTTEVLRQADGVEHHSIVSKFAVPGLDDTTAFVAGMAFDITGRMQAEEERGRLLVEFDAVLNSINEGVVISDLEGNILTMNPSALAMHGYESVEQARSKLHLYQETFELSDLNGRPVPLEEWPLARALRGERFADHEVRVRRKDTGKSWIGSYSGTPVQTKSGDTILAVITLRDITKRKSAQEELRKSEEKFSMIFNTAPVGITISTFADGRFVDINPAGERFSGYRREEVIGRTALEFDIWKDPEERARTIEEILRRGGVRDREMMMKDKSGNLFWASYSAVAVEMGGEKYLLSLVDDITDRKRAEEEIERLNAELAARAAELEAANRELEAFNFTVAHDLRKPLTTINGYCEIIRELCGDRLDEQCKKYLQEAYDGTWRMNRLIDTLLNFSRLSHVEPRRETVDLSGMAHEVAAGLKLAEQSRRAEFRITEGISVIGDAVLLQVVLENLIVNAWKYTGTRKEAVIEFGIMEYGTQGAEAVPMCETGETVYFVRDNGIGFDMADADKLFIPFERLPGTEEFRGFGIGLATVARIIKRHGGRIWAEGETDRGATVYFTLD
jgi:PAS domain S-box-containing protein